MFLFKRSHNSRIKTTPLAPNKNVKENLSEKCACRVYMIQLLSHFLTTYNFLVPPIDAWLERECSKKLPPSSRSELT